MKNWKTCQCHLCKGHDWPFHCGCGAIRRYDDMLTWCSDAIRHREWELEPENTDHWTLTGSGPIPTAGLHEVEIDKHLNILSRRRVQRTHATDDPPRSAGMKGEGHAVEQSG